MSRPDQIGPWAAGLSDAERLTRLRSLRALVQVFAGARHPLVIALAQAEVDPSGEAALMAWETLMGMPARSRRNILCSLAELLKTTPIRERRHG